MNALRTSFKLVQRFSLPKSHSLSFPTTLTTTTTTTTRASFTTSTTLNLAKMSQEFKLKDVTSFSHLKNGDKQEVEVEGVENGKVLLLKVQDQVHATSSNCTHYGAPLSKGVLTPEGRLTCPWYVLTFLFLFS
jgi:nitrite reductase/ring-hydroxylating ferredoxin subunit